MRYDRQLDPYMKSVNRFPYLTREQEAACVQRFRATGNPRALDPMVHGVLKYVVKVAHNFRGYRVAMNDLVQAGNLGLMRAATKFEPERGYRFISYCVHWVRSGMWNHVFDSLSLVKFGTTQAQRKLFFKLKQRAAGVSAEDVARELGFRPEDGLAAEIRLAGPDASLDARRSAGEGEEAQGGINESWSDAMASGDAGGEAHVIQLEAHRAIRAALGQLTARERMIVEARGFSDDVQSLVSLGARLGVSKERVRQIEEVAHGKLYEALRGAV